MQSCVGCELGGIAPIVATFPLPSDAAAEEKSVVSLAQFGEMGRVGAPRHTPVVKLVYTKSALSTRTERYHTVDWLYNSGSG